jgi:3-methyladenine DNA glycosylase AlkD
MPTARTIQRELAKRANPRKAAASAWFFKTGPGEYGEGDRFRGIRVPELRAFARLHEELPREETAKLLRSKWHEDRLVALLILVLQSESGSAREQRAIARFYLDHVEGVNNWDLVDGSAPYLLGPVLARRPSPLRPLTKLARSDNLWERRIAILTTQYFIRRGRYGETFRLARLLLLDEEDLIQKAVGWMLREVGKRDEKKLVRFLEKYAARMPRTMLRYATERLEEGVRNRLRGGRE